MFSDPDPGPDPETFELAAFYVGIWVILILVFGPWWGTIAQFMITIRLWLLAAEDDDD